MVSWTRSIRLQKRNNQDGRYSRWFDRRFGRRSWNRVLSLQAILHQAIYRAGWRNTCRFFNLLMLESVSLEIFLTVSYVLSQVLFVSHYQSPSLSIYHCVSLFLTVFHRFLPPLTVSHHSSPILIIPHRFSPPLTVFHRFSLPLTVSHYLSPFLIIPHNSSPPLTVSHHRFP